MSKKGILKELAPTYNYANENKFSYTITLDTLTVIDEVTKDEWTYGFVGLLTGEKKSELVYEKMREMVKEREMKAQIDKTVKKGFRRGK